MKESPHLSYCKICLRATDDLNHWYQLLIFLRRRQKIAHFHSIQVVSIRTCFCTNKMTLETCRLGSFQNQVTLVFFFFLCLAIKAYRFVEEKRKNKTGQAKKKKKMTKTKKFFLQIQFSDSNCECNFTFSTFQQYALFVDYHIIDFRLNCNISTTLQIVIKWNSRKVFGVVGGIW